MSNQKDFIQSIKQTTKTYEGNCYFLHEKERKEYAHDIKLPIFAPQDGRAVIIVGRKRSTGGFEKYLEAQNTTSPFFLWGDLGTTVSRRR